MHAAFPSINLDGKPYTLRKETGIIQFSLGLGDPIALEKDNIPNFIMCHTGTEIMCRLWIIRSKTDFPKLGVLESVVLVFTITI